MNQHRRSSACLLIIAAWCGVILGGARAIAQTPPELEQEALQLEGLGLTFHPPAGAGVVAEKINGRLVVALSDPRRPPEWFIRVQEIVSALAQPSPAAQIEDQLNRIRQAGQPFTVLENVGTEISGMPAHRCYISINTDTTEVVNGWLIIQTGERSMLAFTLQVMPEAVNVTRRLFETCFETIGVRTAAELDGVRLTQLAAGQRFLGGISPDDLRSLIGLEVWFRTYTPGELGETERGISVVTVQEAPRGQLAPNRLPEHYEDPEREVGLLVIVRGRIVVDAARDSYYDTEARYWMAWDQSEEGWSILATFRQGEASVSESEIGVRTPANPADLDAGFGRLTVVKSESARRSREPYEWKLPQEYLPQTLGWVIGRLMARELKDETQLSYYFYNFSSDPPRLSRRVDTWKPAEDGSGNWTLDAQLTADEPSFKTVYSPRGEMIRRTWTDGMITEPFPQEAIRRLWRSKGLRLGAGG